MTDADELWTACAELLRQQVSEAAWMTWFGDVHADRMDNGTLVLAVPNSLAKERLEGRFLPMVTSVMHDAVGREVPVRLEVRTSVAEELNRGGSLLTGADWSSGHVAGSAPVPPPPPASAGWAETPLNPNFTFESFVIGASNRFAHAAAQSVAETPAKSYNPLFIHGAAGLGKTHLLHAIGNYVRENFKHRHVRYVSTETFMNEFVDAIRTNSMTAFKKRYRLCDVLLIDDIQFMENKEGLQEEFFFTFNSLHEASKQIVITSDRPPKSLATLEDRLRSRFLMGLITDVQPPELETRLAILHKKASMDRVDIPDGVLQFIATHVKDNIRELEGALIRVSAYASLNRQPVTPATAEVVLADILSADQPRPITPKVILDATSDKFGFSVEELCSQSRQQHLVRARQIGMYVFRELTDFSYPAIGREFGNRDHTTVIHAVERVSAKMKEDRLIYDQVTELIHQIRSGA